MSNVPPPKSNTAMVSSFLRSRPYARAAAVGSLMILETSRPAMRPASLVACRCASLKYAGTVMTALVTDSPRCASAASLSLRSTIAEISGGACALPRIMIRTSPFSAASTWNGIIRISSETSENFRPMNRFAENTVFSGLVIAWRFAT